MGQQIQDMNYYVTKTSNKKYVVWKGQVKRIATNQSDSKIWTNRFQFPIDSVCRKF